LPPHPGYAYATTRSDPLSLTHCRCSCKKRTPAATQKKQITQPHTQREKSSRVKMTGMYKRKNYICGNERIEGDEKSFKRL